MRLLRALCAALLCLLCAGETWAHASLVSAVPSDGAVVTSQPEEVVLRFDEEVSVLSLRLVDNTGKVVTLRGSPQSRAQTFTVALPAQLHDGTYLLSYRVASADSHPIGASIYFSIGQPSATAPVDPAATEAGILDGWRIAVRALRDLAMLAAAGMALFVLGVAPFPGERTALVAAAAAAALLSLGSIGLQGAALVGDGDIFAPGSWRVGLDTSYGSSAIMAAGGMLVIAVGAGLTTGAPRKLLLGSGAAAAATSLALTGHAATAIPGTPAVAAIAIHGLAAAFWTGSLVGLLALLLRAGPASAVPLRRFSGIAMVAVALLFAAGAVFAVMELSKLSDLLVTPYGQLILAKIALLGVLIAIAAVNRFVLTGMLERSVPAAPMRLRRTIVAELAVVAAVVTVTAFLVHTPPTRRIAATVAAGAYTAAMSVLPGRAGPNAIYVRFQDRAGLPYDPAEAMVAISNPSVQVEPMRRVLARTGPGIYRHGGGELAFPGRWNIVIRIRIDDFESSEFAAVFDVR